ncbi:MAG: sulfatase-like hydrolase/transferase [bacterium]|nr:hypothetical protein [Planctomycetota bacterium]HIL51700.1 hypothetical protein [Planctomycetota bacterium]
MRYFLHAFAVTAVLFQLLGSPVHGAPQGTPPNLLVLVADDLGVDMLACYGEGLDLPATPVIDGLAASGLKFRNCWANPICTPTRATLQTGRYGFRTGMGYLIGGGGPDLQHSELILPEVLSSQTFPSWSCAMIGKWHLGAHSDPSHANAAGYAHFSGALGNFHYPQSFYNWTKVVNGNVSTSTTYATVDTVNEALAWIATAPEPWMCFVAFNAPHEPFHIPPAGMFSVELPDVDPREIPRPFYKAAIEVMDTEIGRLLAGLPPSGGPPNIIFLGDNGTPREVCAPPFTPEHAKLTMYEGGLGVPLIITGPGVPTGGATCNALINTSDLFATTIELCSATLPSALAPDDSVSLVPYLSQPQRPSLRRFVFAELFRPNGPVPHAKRKRAVRGKRYKLIRRGREAVNDELYDLLVDRYEEQDLLALPQGALSPLAWRALEQLRAELDRLDGA